MARLKLSLWDSVIADCDACLLLAPDNMKAHYYLAQARLGLADLDGALSAALRAHALASATADKSLASVTALVLRCKKERWDHAERIRVREGRALEAEVLELLDGQRKADVEAAADETERGEIEADFDAKGAMLRDVFERARANDEKRREVPEWAIDDISFGIMIDPVIVRLLSFLACSSALLLTADRQKPASRTNAPPSWNTCAATPSTPSRGNRSCRLSCVRTWVSSRPARSFWTRTAGPWIGSFRW